MVFWSVVAKSIVCLLDKVPATGLAVIAETGLASYLLFRINGDIALIARTGINTIFLFINFIKAY